MTPDINAQLAQAYYEVRAIKQLLEDALEAGRPDDCVWGTLRLEALEKALHSSVDQGKEVQA